eukprot:8161919-Pyramimonas_sp.AAC.1
MSDPSLSQATASFPRFRGCWPRPTRAPGILMRCSREPPTLLLAQSGIWIPPRSPLPGQSP